MCDLINEGNLRSAGRPVYPKKKKKTERLIAVYTDSRQETERAVFQEELT